ncbi:MAG: HAD family hydrolase [Gemmatimonadetes bacterium]|nr:HAD family hydrolase [Gemmatimonadota bacterium]
MTEHGRPAVYLDRDGTLVVERHYLADPDGLELVPGAERALSLLRDAGYALVVVTNQSGIARGLYTEADYRAVAQRLESVLAEASIYLDGSYHCPHHPDLTGPCACRKPSTGMYLQAAGELDLAPERSWYVGDKVTDVLPALELGGRGILVRTGYGGEHEASVPDGVAVVDDVEAAARYILAEDDPGGGAAPPNTGRRPTRR